MLTALAVVSFTFANAQDGTSGSEGFTKGDVFISGSFGFNTSSTGDNKTNSFEISPRAGYFVSENFAIGGRVGYQSISQENNVGDFDTNIFSIGGLGRYYFTPANKFSIFGELGLDYFSINTDNGTLDTTTDGFGVGVIPGVSYFLSSNFALEATWGLLSYSTSNPEQGESTDNFVIGLNLDDINLGLVYKF